MNTGDYRTMRKQAKLGPLCMAKIIRALQDGPCTADELCHVSGLAKATIYAYMRAMRKERAAYISGWEKDRMGRDAHMIYRLGDKPDTPRKARTQSENVQAYKARKAKSYLQQALAPWTPKTETIEIPSMAEQLQDEYRTGLDAVDLPDDYANDTGEP